MKTFPILIAFALLSACRSKVPLAVNDGKAPEPTIWIVSFSRATSEDEYREIREKYEPVAMPALLANSERFVDREVRVDGVLNLEFEGDQVCLDPGSLKFLAARNCLGLGLDETSLEKNRREISLWNGYYARVSGTFSAPIPRRGLYGGSIYKVVSIEVVTTPARPLAGGIPVPIQWVTHADFMKKHPGYRFSPPTN